MLSGTRTRWKTTFSDLLAWLSSNTIFQLVYLTANSKACTSHSFGLSKTRLIFRSQNYIKSQRFSFRNCGWTHWTIAVSATLFVPWSGPDCFLDIAENQKMNRVQHISQFQIPFNSWDCVTAHWVRWLVNILFLVPRGGWIGGDGGGGGGGGGVRRNHVHMENIGRNGLPFRQFWSLYSDVREWILLWPTSASCHGKNVRSQSEKLLLHGES